MIEALNARWPGMQDRLCDSTPRVRRHINIFV
ncbi:MAG: sulfur-carrier protein, partial [Acetobacteraceae bacterium]|nr:sulfur-carrier protein [Acetobacteraceae bacterium]